MHVHMGKLIQTTYRQQILKDQYLPHLHSFLALHQSNWPQQIVKQSKRRTPQVHGQKQYQGDHTCQFSCCRGRRWAILRMHTEFLMLNLFIPSAESFETPKISNKLKINFSTNLYQPMRESRMSSTSPNRMIMIDKKDIRKITSKTNSKTKFKS